MSSLDSAVIPRYEGSAICHFDEGEICWAFVLCSGRSVVPRDDKFIYAIKPNYASYNHILNFNTLHQIEKHDFETATPC